MGVGECDGEVDTDIQTVWCVQEWAELPVAQSKLGSQSYLRV